MKKVWRVVFRVRNSQVSVKAESNNEYYARENAKRKFLTQYHYLNLQPSEWEIVSCTLDKTDWRTHLALRAEGKII